VIGRGEAGAIVARETQDGKEERSADHFIQRSSGGATVGYDPASPPGLHEAPWAVMLHDRFTRAMPSIAQLSKQELELLTPEAGMDEEWQ
jgi:hypothetical protein